ASRGHVRERVGPRRSLLEQRGRRFPPDVVDDEREARLAHEARQRLPHVPQADEPHSHRVLLSLSPASPAPIPRDAGSSAPRAPHRRGSAGRRRAAPVRNRITSFAKRLPSRRPRSTTEPRSAPRLLPLPPRMRASYPPENVGGLQPRETAGNARMITC